MSNRTGPSQPPFDNPESHHLLMNCSPLYAQSYYATHPEEEPRCAKEDAAWLRKMNGEAEPFGEEFQERFLQTLILDDKFRRAFINILKDQSL